MIIVTGYPATPYVVIYPVSVRKLKFYLIPFPKREFLSIQLGVDVSAQKFLEAVKELNPDVLGMSALLTTTMPNQKKVIEALGEANERQRVKVIIGGAAVTRKWAEEIEADGYGEDAIAAVALVEKFRSK